MHCYVRTELIRAYFLVSERDILKNALNDARNRSSDTRARLFSIVDILIVYTPTASLCTTRDNKMCHMQLAEAKPVNRNTVD